MKPKYNGREIKKRSVSDRGIRRNEKQNNIHTLFISIFGFFLLFSANNAASYNVVVDSSISIKKFIVAKNNSVVVAVCEPIFLESPEPPMSMFYSICHSFVIPAVGSNCYNAGGYRVVSGGYLYNYWQEPNGTMHWSSYDQSMCWMSNHCPTGMSLDPVTSICEPKILSSKSDGEPECSAGNPINVTVGNKYQKETDYRANNEFPLTVSRSYNSTTGNWRFFSEIEYASTATTVNVVRPDGKGLPFTKDGNVWTTDPDIVEVLTATEDTSGNITGWTLTTRNDQIKTYDAQGRLLSVTIRNGLSHTYAYTADNITVTHTNGSVLTYHLDNNSRVIGFTDPAGNSYQYSYDTEGRLIQTTYPDNSTRQYYYENSNFPNALTGITDENGNRFAIWDYDDQGRAISSEHAHSADKTTLTYNADGSTTVTNASGKQTTYHFTTINDVRKVTQVEGHPTATCEGANKSYTYDTNGNVISKTDWKGATTSYTYDMARNLELSRTEAVGTPQERTVTTEWHSQFRLPIRITEPGKITEFTYDANGNLLIRRERAAQQTPDTEGDHENI